MVIFLKFDFYHRFNNKYIKSTYNGDVMEDYSTIDIEAQRKHKTTKTYDGTKNKNDEKLDRLCKNICLICGWSLVIVLFMYIIMMEFCKC